MQGSTQIGTNGPRNVPDEETIDLVETTNSNNNDDENEFGEFNGGSSVPAEDTSAINASLIDSFVPEKVTSTKNETDIFSNLADFAMTGEPLPSDNFGTNAPDNIISVSPGLHSIVFLLVWQKQICRFFRPWIAVDVLKGSCQIW